MIPVAELQSLVPEARTLIAGLRADQLKRRPSHGGWSVAECIGHLNATNRVYLPEIEKAVAEGRSRGLKGEGNYSMSLFERFLVCSIGPPPRMKMKAPQKFLPDGEADAPVLLAEWESSHTALLTLAEQAKSLDLKRLRVTSPVLSALSMSLLAVFNVIVAHDRRHLLQAKNVLTAL